MGRKGEKIRPCHVCREPVNFVHWAGRPQRIWHWANPDGSHHIHKTNAPRNHFELDVQARCHVRDILNEDFPPWEDS